MSSSESNGKGPVFDTGKLIDLKLMTPEGSAKVITVRFPTDQEWIDRQRRKKFFVKNLGRGKSETIVPDSNEVDEELVAKLRKDDGAVTIDGYEATQALDQLGSATIDDVVREAEGYRVTIQVPGAITSHLIRMPTAKEVTLYRRAFTRILDLPYAKQEYTINLGAAGNLYGALAKEQTGYAGAVPIMHKVVVVKAAIETLESEVGVNGPDF